MRRVRVAVGRTFRSLRARNYRLYFLGQVVSVSGTWMQSVAQAWLVLRLTGSGLALGFTTALQYLPVLVAGPWGGLVADRLDKRRVVMATQSAAGALALALGVLTVTGAVRLWMVFVLAVLLGVVNLVDMPTRQSFIYEMVGPEDLTNAVSLNGVLVNASRVVGPAAAGLLISTVGIGVCFLVNAASYLAVLAALAVMDPSELRRAAPAERKRGQLREGLRYAWSRPDLRLPLLLVAVVALLAYNFSVVLPLLARYAFGTGAGGFGALYSMMGAGAVVGGLAVATRPRATRELLVGATLGMAVMLLASALAPTFGAEMGAMVLVGAASTMFIATANSLLQLSSHERMRGRVMALYSVVFLGSTPLGGPLVGWVAEAFGPRAPLALAAAATATAGLASLRGVRPGARRVALRLQEVVKAGPGLGGAAALEAEAGLAAQPPGAPEVPPGRTALGSSGASGTASGVRHPARAGPGARGTLRRRAASLRRPDPSRWLSRRGNRRPAPPRQGPDPVG